MKIKGIKNHSIEIRIVNYELPYTGEAYDDNWLDIYVHVKNDVENWETVGPCLLTAEVHELIDWLDLLSRDQEPEYTQQRFLEPNLAFYLLNSHDHWKKRLRIEFDAECKPPSLREEDVYCVEFHVTNEMLADMAQSLREELAQYPIRN